ncbi:MAG TPA: FAD-binding protein [Gaiellaceae bacterium]|nr:FAD-binding protein [Gaiellaceae bacterium]
MSTPVQIREQAGAEALRDLVDGQVVLPGDAGWDMARRAWNLAADQRPAAVVFAECADDVVAVVDHARRNGLRITTQGTGHFANTIDGLEDTILLKTSRMRRVEIDPESRTARAEAGVLWEEVVLAASEHGLAALAGSSPDVGVVGYTLGGGLGWLGRRYGLAANSVVAVELVTADGRLVRADARNEPDLFWAVRGGGGSFGVVTALEFRLYEVPEVYAGVLFFPVERAAEILNAWRAWVDGTPEELTSCGRVMHFPAIPEVPEPMRGRSFVLVEAAFIGSEEDGAAIMRPLRELGPELDTLALIPTAELRHMHMDPPQPVPGAGDGMSLAELTPEAIDALVAAAGPESGLLSVELRQLGGAVSRPSPEQGAVGALEGSFALFGVGMAPTPELREAAEAGAAALKAALAPWATGRGYFNFADRPQEGASFYPPETHRRLQEIKADVDPGELFRATHPIRPARLAGLAV